ncbi:34ce6d64-c742-4309-abcd-1148363a702b [Thermothielavioides terrestris]|uniref:Lipocalin-like domain-containing protein n=2 Tax=Thermothielavioides terrestris TaxID=2587410 RepID=G2QWD7_THETT|nr:uncharacterized protein THITE_2041551 [Thermothielavioides terrestris NRRL 8126]AEO63912.1 hypothetical protein THITE_2041551 [Thermothielavioides terrestris NRRL 8126]SPQ23358.1 34ce6d64-c742-4309-abcd-1148363a702b [Thermothielavioides terrestris]
MAAPSDVSMHNLTGSWTMSKSLSDSFDGALAMQGIPWIIRKLASLATLTMKAEHDVDESGARILVFTQGASIAIGGISEEREVRVLDWREEFHSSPIFGTTSHRSRMVNLSAATGHDGKPLDPFLTEPFLDEGEPGGENNLYELVVHQTNGWVMEQLWGFGMLNEQRWLMRTMAIRKGGEVVKARAVYEWNGRESERK